MDDAVFARLRACLSELKTAAVGFSGGADSTLLLAVARDVLEGRVLALTAVTPYMVRQEIAEALRLAEHLGVRHQLVEIPMPEGMASNPADHCYLCKHALYNLLKEEAVAAGFPQVLDGSNVDDKRDFRPGMRALRVLGIRSPFMELGIGKDTIRGVARDLGLPVWSKPTNACLLTRLPFGRSINMAELQRIEEAERFLLERGYDWVRVRQHGNLARIEVDPSQRARLLDDAQDVIANLKGLGFRHVTIDMEGYQLESMNAAME